MKGTVAYFVDIFHAQIMNRLVVVDEQSLHEKYVQLLNEINQEVDETLRGPYRENLEKAFHKIQEDVSLVENEEEMMM